MVRAITAAFLLIVPAASAAQTLQFTARTVTNGPHTIEVEEARLRVPTDHTRPGRDTFELAIARIRSTAAQPGAPIVYLAGGPGGSGIGAGRIGYMFELFLKLREVADVVLLDQRGTGRSQPVPACSSDTLPADVFTTESKAAERYAERVKSCVAEWRAKGVDVAVFNTVQSADDIEALRRALGAPKLSLLGFSYGTHLGLATMRRHGEHIDRAVLAGVEGLDHNWKLPMVVERQVDRIAALAAADPAVAAALPDFKQALREVIARVDREPWVVQVKAPQDGTTIDLPIGGFGLRYLLVRDLGDTNDLPIYPRWVGEMTRGDATYLTRIAERRFHELRTINLMGVATDCASGVSADRLARIRAESPATVLGDVANLFFAERCAAVGVPDLGETFRAAFRTSVPTLFISGTLDMQTPPAQVEEIRGGFTSGVHLIVENAGHESTLPDARVQQMIREFFRGAAMQDTTLQLPPLRFR